MNSMKKILTTVFVCTILLGIASCNDFLEETPKTTLTYQDFYKTQAHIEGNVNYMYRNGATISLANFGSGYLGSFGMVQGMLTGYFSNNYEGQEQVCKYSRELTRQTNTVTTSATVDNVWKDCYKIINVANGSILAIPNIPMSDDSKNQYLAESKFFRAFNYFFLVKTFGDIPFYTTFNSSSEGALYLERTAASEVYKLIEQDLTEALPHLPEKTFADNGHRITRYVAAMLLTDVYMRQRKYSEAAEQARVVINSPHRLTDNEDMGANSAYNKLRTTDDLPEVIYAREYNASISTSEWLPSYAFNASASSLKLKYDITERVYGPSSQFLNIYKSDDLRLQPNQFFHWRYTNPKNGTTWSSEEPGCWYYFDEAACLETRQGTKDWNFYRYAEALLYGAEAIVQAGNAVTSEAARYLAQVQARADMNSRTVDEITTELQLLSKEKFLETCWTEKLREFPLEFKIWDDCVRTGKFPMISTDTPGQVTYVDLIGATNGSGATIKASDLLWPISVNEIQRNPNLSQNEGYSRQ